MGMRSYQVPKVKGKTGYAYDYMRECMEVHGGSKGSRHARITGYLTSTNATAAAVTRP